MHINIYYKLYFYLYNIYLIIRCYIITPLLHPGIIFILGDTINYTEKLLPILLSRITSGSDYRPNEVLGRKPVSAMYKPVLSLCSNLNLEFFPFFFL